LYKRRDADTILSDSETIMATNQALHNEVQAFRNRMGWSQAELARRSGLSRAGVSAIETGRLVPSTAAALALAAAFGCTVESLFRLPRVAAADREAGWASAAPAGPCRYWRAEVAGRRHLYPVEFSALGLLPHDGLFKGGVYYDQPRVDPLRTLVLASCDPAAGMLAAQLARRSEFRLIVLPRASAAALALLARGLVHAAGVHLARSDQAEGNGAAVRSRLAGPAGQGYQLLRVADWDEGIALAPRLRVNSIRAAAKARLRWVDREPGSGARECLDLVLERSEGQRSRSRLPLAYDHRGVAAAIRSNWADAGICLRLTSEEANLDFLSVRKEAYEICFPDALADDPRLQALLQIVGSAAFRRVVGDLPGYDTASTGELRRIQAGTPLTGAKGERG
jgi:molybdate-binding protein/DNA-binding XRE family transcriptional regulator